MTNKLPKTTLPIPQYFQDALASGKAGELYFPNYEALAAEAVEYARRYGVTPAALQEFDFTVLAVDWQAGFCMPQGPLFVAGRSGDGALRDTERLIAFILQYGHLISRIIVTQDTHRGMAVFHGLMWVDARGNHPLPGTQITLKDFRAGKWMINPRVVPEMFDGSIVYAQRYALHYITQLQNQGKKLLIMWPYHVLMGGLDHALVPLLHEAIFFWEVMRATMRIIEIKGGNPLSENFSAISLEVNTIPNPKGFGYPDVPIGQDGTYFFEVVNMADALFVPTQAKSHCGADTIRDIRDKLQAIDPDLAGKIYLPDDMSSSVCFTTPDGTVVDFTDVGDQAYADFAAAGMNVVTAMDSHPWEWPGVIREGWE